MWTASPGTRPRLAVPWRLRVVGMTAATWGRSPGDTALTPSDLPRPARTRNSSHASLLSPADLPPPSIRPVPRPSRGDVWKALADVDVFIVAVEAELEAMDR